MYISTFPTLALRVNKTKLDIKGQYFNVVKSLLCCMLELCVLGLLMTVEVEKFFLWSAWSGKIAQIRKYMCLIYPTVAMVTLVAMLINVSYVCGEGSGIAYCIRRKWMCMQNPSVLWQLRVLYCFIVRACSHVMTDTCFVHFHYEYEIVL